MDNRHHLDSASPGQQKRTTSRALPTRVVDFNLLRVDASVQLYPGLAELTIRLKSALFNRLLAPRREIVDRVDVQRVADDGNIMHEIRLVAQ
jgi:hypothetical protein